MHRPHKTAPSAISAQAIRSGTPINMCDICGGAADHYGRVVERVHEHSLGISRPRMGYYDVERRPVSADWLHLSEHGESVRHSKETLLHVFSSTIDYGLYVADH